MRRTLCCVAGWEGKGGRGRGEDEEKVFKVGLWMRKAPRYSVVVGETLFKRDVGAALGCLLQILSPNFPGHCCHQQESFGTGFSGSKGPRSGWM